MNTIYEKEISCPDLIKYELTGRALTWFAQSYPKDADSIWWKLPDALERIVAESYRRGFANGAGIKEKDPRQQS